MPGPAPYVGAGGEPSRPALAPPGPAPPLMAAPALSAPPAGDAERGTAERSAPWRPCLGRSSGPWRSVVPGCWLAVACRRWISVRRGGKTASRADANQAVSKTGRGPPPSRFRPRQRRRTADEDLETSAAAAARRRPSRPRPGRFEVTAHKRQRASHPVTQLSGQGARHGTANARPGHHQLAAAAPVLSRKPKPDAERPPWPRSACRSTAPWPMRGSRSPSSGPGFTCSQQAGPARTVVR
jgi:hypothetical protein